MSIKNLASIIGALGVGMSGFAKGRAQFQDNERQKVLAQRDDKQFERTQAEWGRQDAARNAVKDAYADVQPEPVVGGGIPEEQAVVGYKANGQTYGDLSDAQQSMVGMNSGASRAKRAADNLAKLGETDLAEKYEARMKTLIKEGTVEALDGVQRGRSSPEAVKKNGGKIVRTLGKEIADRFNSTGTMKASADTMIEDFLTTDASGREVVNSRVVGKDGAPVVDDVQAAYRTMLTAKERFELEDKDGQRFQDSQRIAETVRNNKADQELTRARDANSHRIAVGTLGVAQARERREANQFKAQGPEGQIATIEKVLKTKLSDDDKKRFLGITPKSSGKGGKGGADGKGDDGMDKVTEKVITEAHAEWRASNPTATAQQVAEKLVEFEDFIPKARNQMAIKNSINTTLKGAKPGSREYAAAMDQAKRELGVSDEFLVQSGFKLVKPAEVTRNPGLDPARRVVAEVGAAAPPPKPRPPAEPFRPSMRTSPEQIAQQEQAAAQQQRAAQAKQMAFDISRAQQILASGEGTPQYRQQAAARIALWQKQLAQLQGQ